MNSRSLPSGPRSLVPGGFLPRIWKDPLAFLSNNRDRYGDLVGFQVMTQRFYQINRPEWIQSVLVDDSKNFIKSRSTDYLKLTLGEGLLTREGESHHRAKRMMQPAFHKERLRSYSQAMTDHSRLWSARWDRLGDKTPVLMRMEMMGLSLAIVAKTLFGVDVGQEIRGLESAINTLIQEFRLTSLPFGIWLHKLSLPTRRQFKKAKLQLDSMVDHLIASHRALQGDPDDLLSMILEARDEEGQPMSDVEVRDEAKTIFVAGHDAVSNSLSFAWYMLSQNPEAEARFHEEIDRVLQGRLPTLADVERLKVTEAVFAETLRLYPVSWILARRAIEDYKLGTHVLPKGSILIMSPWVMHRDQRYFPNPLQFDLERWTPAARQARQRFAYFPFGGGPRGCIGEGFAWMEAVLVLATLGQRWRPKTLPNYSFKLDPYITLRIPDSLPMTLEHRKAAVPVT